MNAFDRAWAAEGREYGEDALEQVRLGWEMALESVIEECKYEADATGCARQCVERISRMRVR